ncbi:hypothetical protein Tsubulata_042721 [Turnera subulata]|uniref:Zinc knuckle CX2CX4HX4C domain-containing protein n=1 Tax=Turnera subulata TaxID=218843 RepID=A0A9Q0G3X8_9ROSI|nr:hypothetical protein Tsubulata_042721 [Turnera subulata]
MKAYEDRLSHAVLLVQFADLALSWYHPRILGALGSLVGRTINVDIKTHTAERGQYARVAVEVDLTKPLKGKVLSEKQLYNFSYEGLPQVCLSCGCVGHLIIACPLAKSPTPASVDPRTAPVPALACIQFLNCAGSVGYSAPGTSIIGAWMNATRPMRRRVWKDSRVSNQALVSAQLSGSSSSDT